jgi:hypothetical protein
MAKKKVNEGLFSAARSFSDAFFDGLKSNATNRAIEAAKKNKKVPSQLVNRMVEIDKLSKQLKADLEEFS